MKIPAALALGLCVLSFPAFATDLITEPEDALYVAPPVYNGSFVNKMGDISVADPTWHVAQWNNPQPFASGQNYSGQVGSDWQFSTHTARVQFYSSGIPGLGILEHTHELAQQGADADYPLPCGKEFDLFLEANTGDYKNLQGKIAAYRFSRSRSLSQLSHATFRFGLTVPYENVSQTCALNYVGYLVAAYLSSKSGYSMFYQVFLRDSRGISQNNTPCLGYPAGMSYCFSSTIDQLTGQQMQQVGLTRIAYGFDILPSLAAAIATTPDPNLSDWQITGTYYGELMQGGMAPVSRWDSMILSAY